MLALTAGVAAFWAPASRFTVWFRDEGLDGLRFRLGLKGATIKLDHENACKISATDSEP